MEFHSLGRGKLDHCSDRPAGCIEIPVKLAIGEALGALCVVQFCFCHVIAGDAPCLKHLKDGHLGSRAGPCDTDTLVAKVAKVVYGRALRENQMQVLRIEVGHDTKFRVWFAFELAGSELHRTGYICSRESGLQFTVLNCRVIENGSRG